MTISLGGYADTMGAVTGAIVAAFYDEIPGDISNFTMSKLPKDKKVVIEFEGR